MVTLLSPPVKQDWSASLTRPKGVSLHSREFWLASLMLEFQPSSQQYCICTQNCPPLVCAFCLRDVSCRVASGIRTIRFSFSRKMSLSAGAARRRLAEKLLSGYMYWGGGRGGGWVIGGLIVCPGEEGIYVPIYFMYIYMYLSAILGSARWNNNDNNSHFTYLCGSQDAQQYAIALVYHQVVLSIYLHIYGSLPVSLVEFGKPTGFGIYWVQSSHPL